MSTAPPARAAEAIGRALAGGEAIGEPPGGDESWRRARWTPAGENALNATWHVELAGRRSFVKLSHAASRAMYEAEAAGLQALGRTGTVRVPGVHAVGGDDDHAWLVLEWLDLAPGGRDAALGRAIAALHRVTAPRFGWERDNTIGATPQSNAWDPDWTRFYCQHRLAPQLALAAQRGYRSVAREGERLLSLVPQLLAGHSPAPSLLHGDLWSGNAARLGCSARDVHGTPQGGAGEPVVFDPATYYGDREADLAMTELFGGFAADFYAAYREAWPVDQGYVVRRTLYNLYHVLNHLNLFDGGYASQARQMIERLRVEAA